MVPQEPSLEELRKTLPNRARAFAAFSLPKKKKKKVVKAGAHASAQKFEEGTIVGIGWHGNHCLACEACSDGDFVCCDTQ